MSFVSKRDEIKKAIDGHLRTVLKTSLGFQTNVARVFSDESDDDKIPMGLEFDPGQLPAIISLAGDDAPNLPKPGNPRGGLVHGKVYGNWQLELQLWNDEVSDSAMNAFVRDVYKALYAGTSNGTRKDYFRTLHPKLYDLEPLTIEHDLNMIQANRCFVLMFMVRYTTELWDM